MQIYANKYQTIAHKHNSCKILIQKYLLVSAKLKVLGKYADSPILTENEALFYIFFLLNVK